MKPSRGPVLAVIVAILLVALVFDPEPRRLATVAPSSVVAVVPSSVSSTDGVSDVWFCAGGTAIDGGFADHRVVLVNTTGTERVAAISASGSRGDAQPTGATGVRRVTLPAFARSELRLAELVPGAQFAGATIEISGGGIVVEHSVTGPTGFDRAPCASSASADWFVPLSATATEKNPTARAVIVVYNPFADNAVVDVDFVTDAASAAAPIESMVVSPGAVETLDLTTLVPVADQVATVLRARAGRIVVDRIEVFDDASARRDLVLTGGVPAAATAWFIPSGRFAPPRVERLVVQNPGSERAEVTVEVRPDNRDLVIEPFVLQIGGGRFAVVDLSAEKRLSEAGVAGYSVVVRSSGPPIAVERVVTVAPGQPGAGASSTTGAAFASPTVVVPVTTVENAPGELVVFNPNARAIATVSLEAIVNGQRQAPPGAPAFELQPGERRTMPLTQLGAGNFVVIANASAPIVIEWENTPGNTRVAGMGLPLRALATIPRPITLELGE
jgi:hypothetical protein